MLNQKTGHIERRQISEVRMQKKLEKISQTISDFWLLYSKFPLFILLQMRCVLSGKKL